MWCHWTFSPHECCYWNTHIITIKDGEASLAYSGHPPLLAGGVLWYSQLVMALKPGTRLGPYEITAAIGAGGRGEVYRATDTKLRWDVAIKILPADFTGDPERRSRFLREARASAAVNHPNIATVHEVDEANQYAWRVAA